MRIQIEINRRNVDEIRLQWAYTMRDSGRWVATPIVANGLMYVAESDRITAFDVPTGDVAWVHQRSYPDDIQKSQAFGQIRIRSRQHAPVAPGSKILRGVETEASGVSKRTRPF